jgi:hypothetical protein
MTIDRRTFLASASAGLAGFPAILRAQPGGGDARILEQAYGRLHPGLYRYARPEQVSARFAALGEQLRAAPDLAAKFLALSRFTGTVRCGHSYPNFFNQRREVAEALFAGRNRLPFQFRWLGSRMIVTSDTEGFGLAPGTEVLAIDGRSAPSILRALLPLARADGGNDAKRRALLSVDGNERFESFDIYFPLLFPMRTADYELRVRLPGGTVRTVRLAPIDLARRRASMPPEPPREANPGWTLDHRGTVAVITMPNWGLYNSRWDWRAWILQSFEEMARRSSSALILDLRDNEGGLDCGDRVIAHLIDRPLLPPAHERRVRFREAPAELRPYLDTWDRSFDRLGADATEMGGGFLRLPAAADDTIQPLAPRFNGRVIVLTSATNSSATFQFASLMRHARLATLVGETTGGNRRGINGGAYYFVRLPESGIEVDLPLIGYFPETPQPDAGIVPDVMVAPTAADIAAGRDAVMARALTLGRG